MTNSIISKMTAMKEMIARHIPVAQVLRRVPSSLLENVFHPESSVIPGNWSSNEGKSSSPSTTHVHTMVKKEKTYTMCIVYALMTKLIEPKTYYPQHETHDHMQFSGGSRISRRGVLIYCCVRSACKFLEAMSTFGLTHAHFDRF